MLYGKLQWFYHRGTTMLLLWKSHRPFCKGVNFLYGLISIKHNAKDMFSKVRIKQWGTMHTTWFSDYEFLYIFINNCIVSIHHQLSNMNEHVNIQILTDIKEIWKTNGCARLIIFSCSTQNLIQYTKDSLDYPLLTWLNAHMLPPIYFL